MARSKDVYAVIGLMCVDDKFCNQFFANWQVPSKKLVGSLSDDEKRQLMNVWGEDRTDRDAYVTRLKTAFGAVRSAMNCPSHPCPDPDPYLDL